MRAMYARITSQISPISNSWRLRSWRGVSAMISCAPTPFIRSWNLSARRPNTPSIRKRGSELGNHALRPAGPVRGRVGMANGEDFRRRGSFVGFAEWAKRRFPDEFLEKKIGGPHRRGVSHDYPATSENVFPHLGHLCSNLSRIPLTSLFAPTPHFRFGYLLESRDGLQQPFSKCLLNLLVCGCALQRFQGLAAFI